MTKEKRERLEEIIHGTAEVSGHVRIDCCGYDFLITELKSAWQREEDLLKGLDSIRTIVLEK